MDTEIFIPCNVLHYFTYSEISFPFFFNRLKMQKPSSSQFWKQVIDQLQAVVWRLLFLRANFSSKFQKIFDKFCQCSTTGTSLLLIEPQVSSSALSQVWTPAQGVYGFFSGCCLRARVMAVPFIYYFHICPFVFKVLITFEDWFLLLHNQLWQI